ncbi:hypothetical protein E2C01_028044 [Portunus trituberculatus]|uniref:Uncharacterized protein n=1 Tax=Portunus trituberculatus TaxID=210409 RepID=A0A5B7EMV2_PORTR|nr:hypothetical protein [Portunus trituberculatus]
MSLSDETFSPLSLQKWWWFLRRRGTLEAASSPSSSLSSSSGVLRVTVLRGNDWIYEFTFSSTSVSSSTESSCKLMQSQQ